MRIPSQGCVITNHIAQAEVMFAVMFVCPSVDRGNPSPMMHWDRQEGPGGKETPALGRKDQIGGRSTFLQKEGLGRKETCSPQPQEEELGLVTVLLLEGFLGWS